MANSKSSMARPNFRFLPPHTDASTITACDSAFEFHEADLYNSGSNHFPGKPLTTRHSSRSANNPPSSASSSQPVNIPDWSEILGDEYARNRRTNGAVDAEDDNVDVNGVRIPPHEFLAKTRMASLSVQEGVGRTLKGRDLSRLRNAIWAKFGFQD